jgi:undecaprenyl-diphosphatase
MSYLDAIILGFVQGVAEFLPISSDGHLVVAEHMLGIKSDLLALNVALHIGSLMAILVVFRNDLAAVLKNRPLMIAIVVATLPLVPVALFLKDFIDRWAGSPVVAGFGLCLTALLLLLSQRFETDRPATQASDPALLHAVSQPPPPDLGTITWLQALVVGLLQTVAIAPGVSRSGSTIVAGLMQGFPRNVAARFAFLIAIPALAGATVFKAKDMLEVGATGAAGPIVVGTLISFVVGIVSLSWLLRIVTQRRLHWFGWYCLILGLAVIAWTLQQ